MKEIEVIYSTKLNDNKKLLNDVREKLCELSNLATYLSGFNHELIGNILADIMTEFEGEKYEYYQKTVREDKNSNIFVPCNFVGISGLNLDDNIFISYRERDKNSLTKEDLKNMRDVLFLNVKYPIGHIVLLEWDMNGNIVPMNCNGNDYLIYFIFYLVGRRMENENDLNKIKNEFLVLNADRITQRLSEKKRKLTLN